MEAFGALSTISACWPPLCCLTGKGLATWNVEYRRVGNPGGGWPGTFEDIANAYRFLPQIAKRYDLDTTELR